MTEDELNKQIDQLKVGDFNPPNFLVKPFPFLIEYVHICSRRSRYPLAAQMLYLEGDFIGRTFQNGFTDALDRHVDVYENIDSYVTMITKGQKNKTIIAEGPSNSNYAVLQEKQRLFEKFKEKGGHLNFINPPGIIRQRIPQAGSNHMKFYFGNDLGKEFAYAGKVNIAEGDFAERPDFLIKYTDPGIISAFKTLFTASKEGTLKQDMIRPCNDQTTLHIDSGKPLRSAVQRRVSEAIASAKISIEGVEPFFPDLFNLLALNMANKRDVTVDIVSSDPKKFTDDTWTKMASISRQIYDRLARGKYVSMYPGWVHAAMRIFDRKMVIFTTHNLSFFGTLVGTAEWAVETTDPAIVSQCVKFFSETKAASVAYHTT